MNYDDGKRKLFVHQRLDDQWKHIEQVRKDLHILGWISLLGLALVAGILLITFEVSRDNASKLRKLDSFCSQLGPETRRK